MLWSGKPYYTWNHYLREIFGEKVAKVSLDVGFTCPNRVEGRGGCIYCSPRGSGDCAGSRLLSISQQFAEQREAIARKWPGVNKYIAYFQAYTNTLAPREDLERLYREALGQEGIVGLSISTRPDCLPPGVLTLLEELNKETLIWLELGLQSSHDQTLGYIQRGHTYRQFVAAVKALQQRGIRVCAHIILGLPGEGREMMRQTARRLAELKVEGVKVHALHIVKDTKLADFYQAGLATPPTRADYITWVVDTLELLPPETVVHRLTGDAPREILLAPKWILEKWAVIHGIAGEFAQRNTWQGKSYS
jgi:radical SAM protein (TIGR01212 family)